MQQMKTKQEMQQRIAQINREAGEMKVSTCIQHSFHAVPPVAHLLLNREITRT